MLKHAAVCLVGVGIGVAVSSAALGQSGLLGDTYTFSGFNLPNSFGITIDPETQEATDHGTPPVTLTFDGIAEQAGGLTVNERVHIWGGRPGGIFAVQEAGIDGITDFDLIEWENPGEVVEFSFQTTDGGYLSAEDDLGQSGYTVKGLDWNNAEPEWTPEYFEDGGFYFYFSHDGVPVTGYQSLQPDLGVLVGEHPFDPNVEEVIFIAYSSGQVEDVTEPYPGGMDFIGGTTQLDETFGSWDLLGEVMGQEEFISVNGQPANGVHAGFLTTAPEDAFPRNALQAGDADQDLDFDQFDLIRVQQSGLYLTDQPATWGDGDWDGAPGGVQGSPPAGNGRFDQLDIIKALAAGTYLTGPYAAISSGGQRGDDQTSIIYDANSGEVSVDAPAGVLLTSINIDSAAKIFVGDAAQNLGGSFDNDADGNIFKATFGGSFGSISFGAVAQPGLEEQFVMGDLTVVGSLAGGGDLGDVDLIYIAVPEPSTFVLAMLALVAFAWRRRR